MLATAFTTFLSDFPQILCSLYESLSSGSTIASGGGKEILISGERLFFYAQAIKMSLLQISLCAARFCPVHQLFFKFPRPDNPSRVYLSTNHSRNFWKSHCEPKPWNFQFLSLRCRRGYFIKHSNNLLTRQVNIRGFSAAAAA